MTRKNTTDTPKYRVKDYDEEKYGDLTHLTDGDKEVLIRMWEKFDLKLQGGE